MSNTTRDAVTDRLDRLERANRRLNRECRRWRWGGASVFVASAVLLIGGADRQESSRTLEAGHFVLRDEAGRMRAALAIRPDGTPGMGFFDEEGQVRLSFDLSENGDGGVNLHDDQGVIQAALAVRSDGTPGMALFDENGRPRLSLDTGRDGSAGLNLYGRSGTLRGAIAIRPDGTPALGLFDQNGQIGESIELDPVFQDRGQPG